MKPYDLKLRPLQFCENVTSADLYNQTFVGDPNRTLLLSQVEQESPTMVSLTSKDVALNEPYVILAKYSIVGTISTSTRVTESEASKIIADVKKALFREFNAREVDFGAEIE